MLMMVSGLVLPLLLHLFLWRPSSETAVCPGGQFCAVDGEACLGYFSDEGVLKAAGTCVSGRCRCNVGDDEGWDPCSCLPIVGDCRVERNAPNAVGMPVHKAVDDLRYSCVSSGSMNCRHDVHVIANYEGGSNSAVPVSVVVEGINAKPLVFVLMSSKPVHWIFDVPDDVDVQRVTVILAGRSTGESYVSFSHNGVQPLSFANSSIFGYGPDSDTPLVLDYVQKCLGPIASFSGKYSSEGWRLNISRSNQARCDGTPLLPLEDQCITEIQRPIPATSSSPLGALRLIGGRDACSGLLQVFASCADSPPQWLHLWGGGFGIREASVACRELGCPAREAISDRVTSMYSVFIEKHLECQGSEEHLFSCASTSNETCDTQVHNSSADFVMLFCTNGDSTSTPKNVTGGNATSGNSTDGTTGIPTSHPANYGDKGQTKSGDTNGSSALDNSTRSMATNPVSLISPTSSSYAYATWSIISSTKQVGASSPTNAVANATTATKKPKTSSLPTNTPFLSPATKQPSLGPTQPKSTSKPVDITLNSKKGPPGITDTSPEDANLTTKYIAGSLLALILAMMVLTAVGMSIYYHNKQRRERRRDSSRTVGGESREPAALPRSESAQTNSRLLITDQSVDEGVSVRGCSEPPPSYHSVAVAEPPPPAYDTLVMSHPPQPIRMGVSLETVV